MNKQKVIYKAMQVVAEAQNNEYEDFGDYMTDVRESGKDSYMRCMVEEVAEESLNIITEYFEWRKPPYLDGNNFTEKELFEIFLREKGFE